MVVGAMIEFAVLLHMRRNCEHKVLYEIVSKNNVYEEEFASNSKQHSNLKNGSSTAENLLNLEKPVFMLEDTIKKERRAFTYKSHKVDYIALLIFGLLFSIFNGFYWIFYLFL